MGLFDGADRARRDFASTAHVARLLGAPVILVVDARGVAASAAALLHGFATFDPRTRVGGVILNRVGSDRHEELLREAAPRSACRCSACCAGRTRLTVPSRHLGLIPAAELGGPAADAVAALAAVVADGVDLEAVVRLARARGRSLTAARSRDHQDPPKNDGAPPHRPRVAIAGGPAFTFGYAEHPELLAAAGAEVVTFDPLRDERLPGDGTPW